jgi:hypothetical protein
MLGRKLLAEDGGYNYMVVDTPEYSFVTQNEAQAMARAAERGMFLDDEMYPQGLFLNPDGTEELRSIPIQTSPRECLRVVSWNDRAGYDGEPSYFKLGGTVFATSIVISAISDQRLKENIRDIDTGLSTIMALKPRRFDWKKGKGQDKKNAAGFIAQEYQEVLPNSISTFKQGDDGIDYLTMNHEELIPTLVKAIQELKAEFDAYKTTHP